MLLGKWKMCILPIHLFAHIAVTHFKVYMNRYSGGGGGGSNDVKPFKKAVK